MWDKEVTLISIDGYGEQRDKIGNRQPKYKRETVLGIEKPVPRTEFYVAGQVNIRVSKLIVVHPFEYNNQKIVEIEKQLYSVVRSYQQSIEEVELTLEIKGDAINE